ncbi:MAG: tail fiber domain-containing protein [Candidatus Aenigmarchaeota archaeon]|nr:tail fiber domain-containing protein [Candidatus Aenigmarchaeota archaeon]
MILLPAVITFSLFSSTALAAPTQSHPLSQLFPQDVNLNLTGVNVTNVSNIFFGNGSTDTYINRSSANVLGVSNNILTGGWVNASYLNASASVNTTTLCIAGICKSSWPSAAVVGGSGTANYIPIWTAGDTLGNSLIYQTGGNVGINITTPSSLLHVNGTGNLLNVSNRTQSFLYVSDTRPIGWVGIGTTTPLSTLEVSGNLSVSGSTNSSIDGSTFFVDATNNRIGIGTTGPSSKLHIYESTDNTAVLKIESERGSGDAGNILAELQFINLNGVESFTLKQYVASGDISFGTNSDNTKMTLTYAGNVGIGTTSPSTKLDVIGGINASQINITGSGTLLNVSNRTHSQLYVNDTGIGYVIVPQGNVGIGTTAPSERLHVLNTGTHGTIRLENTGTTASAWAIQSEGNSGTAALRFYSYTASAYRMSIDGSGNVGIGTTSPSTLLDVRGGINASQINITGTGSLLNVSNRTQTFLFVNETAGAVGIGTTIPSAKLHISGIDSNGGIELDRTSNSVSDWIVYKPSGTLGATNSQWNIGIPENVNYYVVRTWDGSTNTDRLVVLNSSGNVGIGTTSPGNYKLNVIGDINASWGNFTNVNISSTFNAPNVNSAGGWINASNMNVTNTIYSSQMILKGTGTLLNVSNTTHSILYVNETSPNGYIGIGTNIPKSEVNMRNGIFLQEINGTPTELGGLETGDAINATFISGKYAFIAANISGYAFTIVDISDPNRPAVVGGNASNIGINSIYVAGKYAYLGTDVSGATCSGTAIDGCEVQIYDITNISGPKPVGGINTALKVKQVFVQGKYLYVALGYSASTCAGTTLTGCEFQVYDVSNPSSPTALGGFQFDASVSSRGAQGLYVDGKYAYVTHGSITTLSWVNTVLDVSNPSVPINISAFGNGNAHGTGIFKQGNYVYRVGDAGANQDFGIFNASNPASMTKVGGINGFNGVGVFVAGRYAYVGAVNNFVQIIDISNPASPIVRGRIDVAPVRNSMPFFVSGKYIYLGASGAISGNEFKIYDLSGIDAPSASIGALSVGELDVLGRARVTQGLDAQSLSIGFGGIQSAGSVSITAVGNTTSTGSVLDVRDSSQNSLFYIQENGRVGIGTTSPGNYKLNVIGDINASWVNATNVNISSTFNAPNVNSAGGWINASNMNVTNTLYTTNLQSYNWINATNLNVSGTRNVSINSPTFFVDTTNSRVGIGTTAPGYRLHIVDSGNSAVMTTESTSATGIGGIGIRNADRFWSWQVRGDISDGISLRDETAGAHRILIDSSGNVGINTTSPNAKLEVSGRIRVSGTAGDTSGVIEFNPLSGSVGYLYRDSSDNLHYESTAGTDRLTILNSSGNVGIGTTSPGNYKLNVIGDINASWGNFTNVNISSTFNAPNVNSAGGWINASNMNVTNTLYSTDGRFLGSVYQPIYPSDVGLVAYLPFDENASGISTVYDKSPYGNDGTTAGFGWNSSSGWTTGKYGNALLFDGTADYVSLASSSSLNFISGGEYTFEAWIKANNVGGGGGGTGHFIALKSNTGNGFIFKIGQTSTLRIGNTTSASDVLGATTLSTGKWYHAAFTKAGSTVRLYLDGIQDASGTIIFASNTEDALTVSSTGSGFSADSFDGIIDEVKVYTRALTPEEIRTQYLGGLQSHGTITADKFRIMNTSSNVSFFVDITGNVGIGTTTPGQKLAIVGTSNITGGSATTIGLFVDSNGRIGLGTSSPGNYKLNVIGDINASWGNFTDINVSRTFNAPNVVSAGGWMNASNMNVTNTLYTTNLVSYNWLNATNLNVSGTRNVSINSPTFFVDTTNSRVGIGTTNPLNKLQISADNELLRFTRSATTKYVGLGWYTGTTQDWFVGTRETDDVNAFHIWSNNGAQDRVTITNTGNVGIGTTSPSTKLDVIGGINASQINITGTGTLLNVSNRTQSQLYVNDTGIGYVIIPNGNVGIGTTAPVSPLQVSASVNIDEATAAGGNIQVTNTYNANGAVMQQWYSTGATPNSKLSLYGTGSDSAFQSRIYSTGAVSDILLNPSGGNVGIGTISPGNYKLNVIGDINASWGNFTDINVSRTFNAPNVVSAGGWINASNMNVTNTLYSTDGRFLGSVWQPVYPSDDGLVLYLPFSENTSTTAYDRSPYGNDGTLTNISSPATSLSGWTANGKFGNALILDGVNDYVNVGNDTRFYMTDAITISAWIKGNSTQATNSEIISKEDYPSGWGLYGSGNLVIGLTGSGWTGTAISTSFTTGVWYHVVGTYDSSSGSMKAYVNGVLESTVAGSGTITTGRRPLYIGTSEQDFARVWNGTIDEVRIYNRALSAEEIRTQYLGGLQSHGAVTADRFRIVNTSANKIFEVNRSRLEYDTSKLVVDSSGSVGIGTTSPSSLLHISGANAALRIADSNGAPKLSFVDGTTTKWNITMYSNNNLAFDYQGNERINLTSGGNLTVDSNTLHVDATNDRVGIGTTNPQQALNVIGAINLTKDLIFVQNVGHRIEVNQTTTASTAGSNLLIRAGASSSSGTTTGGTLFLDGGTGRSGGDINLTTYGNSYTQGASTVGATGSIYLVTDSLDWDARRDGTGSGKIWLETGSASPYVGEVDDGFGGTTTSARPGNASGITMISGPGGDVWGHTGGTGWGGFAGNITLTGGRGGGFNGTGGTGVAGTGSSIVLTAGRGGYSNFTTQGNGGNIELSAGIVPSGASGGLMLFKTNNTERMRITSDGNVGIGTTSPGNYKLNVIGDINASWGNFTNVNISSTFNAPNVNSAGGWINASNMNVTSTIYTTNLQSYNWLNATNLNVSGTKNVSINSPTFFIDTTNSRIGINTTSPATPLHVQSANNALLDVGEVTNYTLFLRYPISTNNVGTGIAFGVSANTNNVGSAIIHERTGGDDKGSLRFYTKTTTAVGGDPREIMVLSDSGYVGINTSTPQALLNVLTDPATSTVAANITNLGSGNSFVVEDSAADTTPFVIDSSGNVGIGTTSPSTKLDVRGGINASQINITGSGTLLNVSNRTHSQLYVNDTGIGYVIIPQGNVGIGTTIPSARLQVDNSNATAGLITRGYSTADLLTSIQAFWKLDEASGDRADSVGSNTLTDTNTVTQGAGKIGNAGDFENDNNEYLQISDNAALSVANADFTISAWVNIESLTDGQIAGKADLDAVSTAEYHLGLTASTFRFFVGDGVSSVTQNANTFGVPPTGTWIFVVAWHDATADTVYIQVNNGAIDSSAYTAGSNDGTNQFRIGADSSGGTRNFDGLIDAVGFWKKVLTADERTALYNGGGSGAGMEHPFTQATNLIEWRDIKTNVLGVINGTGSVGIGTTSPGNYKLNVIGDINASWVNATNLNVTNTFSAANFVGTSWGNFSNLNVTNNAYIGTGTAIGTNTIASGTRLNVSGGNVTMDEGTLFVDATNNRVGIKTTSPGSEIDVNGNANINNPADSSTALTVTSSGSSSTTTLDLTNTVSARTLIKITGAAYTGAATSIWFNAFASDDTQPRLQLSMASSGQGVIWFGDGTNAIDTNLYRTAANTLRTDDSFRAAGTWLNGTNLNISGTQNVSINSPTFFVDTTNNKVGMGTTNPREILEIRTPNAENDMMYFSSSGVDHGVTGIVATDIFGTLGNVATAQGTLRIRGLTSSGSGSGIQMIGIIGVTDPTDTVPAVEIRGLKEGAAGDINYLGASETVFAVNNGGDRNSFVITGDGRVGINSSLPSSALHINSTGSLLNVSNSTHSQLYVNDTGIGYVIVPNGNVGIGTTSPGNYKLNVIGDINASWVNSSSLNVTGVNNVSIDAPTFFVDVTNNRVGINTTNPATPLHIQSANDALIDVGTVSNYNLFLRYPISTNNVGTGIAFGVSANTNNVGSAIIHERTGGDDKGSLRFYTKTTTIAGADPREIMVLSDSGYVGINTSTPQALLNVLTDPATSTVAANITNLGSGNSFVVEDSAADTTPFVIDSSGNVGIGTTSPGNYKLNVIGDINASWVNASNINVTGGTIQNLDTGGLLCKAYNDTSHVGRFTGMQIKQWKQSTIDFTDIDPGQANSYTIRCVGYIKPIYSQEYRFNFTSDDGVRMWIDGREMNLTNTTWKDQSPTSYYSNISLTVDAWYPIVIEHYENAGGERLVLEWESPSQARQVVPSTAFAFSAHEQAPTIFGTAYFGSIGIGTTNLNPSGQNSARLHVNASYGVPSGNATVLIESPGSTVLEIVGGKDDGFPLIKLNDKGTSKDWNIEQGRFDNIFGIFAPGYQSAGTMLAINGTTSTVGIKDIATGAGTSICYMTTNITSMYTFASCSSSKRYKEDITPLTFDKEKLFQLEPVSFKWKSNGETSVGLIAEDVEPLFPELVTYKDGQVEGVEYKLLTVYLLDVLKEHENRLASLENGNNHVNNITSVYASENNKEKNGHAQPMSFYSLELENEKLRNENQALKSKVDGMESRLAALESKILLK